MGDNKEIFMSVGVIPEMDEEEENLVDNLYNAFNEYEQKELIDMIGTDEFKENYLNFIGDIRKLPTTNQKTFCNLLLNKINEEYNFEFVEEPPMDNSQDFDDIYKFVEFIEYNNVDFCSFIFYILRQDGYYDILEKNPINDENFDIIVEKALSIIDNIIIHKRTVPILIKSFLKSCNRDVFKNIFFKMLSKNLQLIRIKIVSQEFSLQIE